MSEEFADVEERFASALNALISGDSLPLKGLLSRRDDATAFLSFGGWERGWSDLDERWEWARAVFAGGKLEAEMVSRHVGDTTAVTLSIERGEIRYARNPAVPARMTLRVTHVWRKEDGAWRLVHRHADDLHPSD